MCEQYVFLSSGFHIYSEKIFEMKGKVMNAVYELEDGRSLALYMEGNRVLALTTPLRRGALPALLKNDCLGKLHSVLYRGNISYVYENFSHQIVFDTVNPGNSRVILSPTADASRFDGVQLRELSGQLCLIFQAWNPINESYSLCCQNVFSRDLPDTIHKGYTQRLRLQWLTCGEGEYLVFLETPEASSGGFDETDDVGADGASAMMAGENMLSAEAAGDNVKVRERWYKIEDAHFFAWTRPGGGNEGGLRASGCGSGDIEPQLAAVREEYEAQLAVVRGDYEAQLAAVREEYEAQLAGAREEYEAQFAGAREEYEAQLAAAQEAHEAQFAVAREDHEAQLADAQEKYEAQLAAAQEAHEAQLTAVREEYEGRLKELKGRCSLLESAVADYEERLAEIDEVHEARQKALEERTAQQLQKQKAGYEAQLESAKKQYAELAKTAVELQKVGRLWRDKYLGDNN